MLTSDKNCCFSYSTSADLNSSFYIDQLIACEYISKKLYMQFYVLGMGSDLFCMVLVNYAVIAIMLSIDSKSCHC